MQGCSKSSKSRIEMPESVVMDILSKLPVQSLARFRCVCKTWSSSFQTSHFITKHHHNNLKNNNLNLLLRRCYGKTHYFSALSTEKGQNFLVTENIHFPFFKKTRFPLVSGPCNGLICLRELDEKTALWNPSTREFKIIPKSTVPRPPFSGFYCSGFGFDSTTDDYKVLSFVTNYEKDEFGFWINQVELYSLKSDCWKEISVPEARPYESGLFNSYINGFYYWLAKVLDKLEFLILSFDMADEKFSTLSLPRFGGFPERYDMGFLERYDIGFLDFKGHLGAIFYPREGTEKSFNLWVMNGEWTRQFSIESVPGVERPLGFWKNGEMFLESSNEHWLVFFDPITRELKNLGIDTCLDNNENTMQLIAYVETLVPINGRSEREEHIIHQRVR